MSDPYIGEIRMFGGNFAPRGWALCQGQLLGIAQNSALFAILGTSFGGNGTTNFGLPDLQGRVPMNWGQGVGLASRTLGEQGGSETVILQTQQMPAHNHMMMVADAAGDQPSPSGNFIAQTIGGDGSPLNGFTGSGANSTMNPSSISVTGNSQPHGNMQPYLAVTFIIALEGIFPPRP